LMKSVSSCIFLSQVLSCWTNSSSVFPLISILSLSSEILSSAYSSPLEWPSIVFCISVSLFFLRFCISWVTSSLILSIFVFTSFISVFIVFSVSLWCLFRAPMSSFICFCVFSYSLFLLSWNFLSASYTFWLTMSSNISTTFSVITLRISSLRMFSWAALSSLVSFIFVLLESGTGYPFSSFPSESYIKLFWGREWFPSLFHPPITPLGTLQLCSW
jgi:hypothetical protein